MCYHYIRSLSLNIIFDEPEDNVNRYFLTAKGFKTSRRFLFADTKHKRLQSLSRLTAPAPFAQRAPLNLVYLCENKKYFPIYRGVGNTVYSYRNLLLIL